MEQNSIYSITKVKFLTRVGYLKYLILLSVLTLFAIAGHATADGTEKVDHISEMLTISRVISESYRTDRTATIRECALQLKSEYKRECQGNHQVLEALLEIDLSTVGSVRGGQVRGNTVIIVLRKPTIFRINIFGDIKARETVRMCGGEIRVNTDARGSFVSPQKNTGELKTMLESYIKDNC